MDQNAPRIDNNNYAILRDCLAEPLILKSAPPAPPLLHNSGAKGGGKKPKGGGRSSAVDPVVSKKKKNDTPEPSRSDDDAEELAEFIDYLASEIFTSFPPDLQTLSHATITDCPRLATTYADPLPAKTASALLASVPVSVTDTLTSYLLLPSSSPTTTTATTTSTLSTFLTPILHSYISSTTITTPPPPPPPPPSSQTRNRPPAACEICSRDWIPLTAHHLVPRSVHAKALKRGWHGEERLHSVARLCRACHSFVHGLCGNEELARRWWSVELLVGREDVRRWGEWAGRVRWKKR